MSLRTLTNRGWRFHDAFKLVFTFARVKELVGSTANKILLYSNKKAEVTPRFGTGNLVQMLCLRPAKQHQEPDH